MKILVTGAAGFLGRNVLDFLARERVEAEVVAMDLSIPSDLPRANPGQWEPLDVRDGAACNDVFRRVRPTHVLHAAAVTLTDETAETQRLMVAVNLLGACHVMDAARAAGSVRRCVVLSSSGVYGASTGDEMCDEDHGLHLADTYAWTKREAELEMEARARDGSISYAAARVGPVYGPYERSRSTRPRVSLVQQLADALCDGRPVRVAGTDYTRDWTHAADVAAALTGLLEAPELRERLYNVSSGVAVDARAVIALFAEMGLAVEWTGQAEGADLILRPEQSRSPLRTERLRRDTGFAARFDLRSGVADVLSRMRDRWGRDLERCSRVEDVLYERYGRAI